MKMMNGNGMKKRMNNNKQMMTQQKIILRPQTLRLFLLSEENHHVKWIQCLHSTRSKQKLLRFQLQIIT